MAGHTLVIRWFPTRLAIVRLPPGDEVPAWAWTGALSAVVRTPDELSVVCDQGAVPGHLEAERDWLAFRVEGPLPFSMTGVLASLLEPLASGGVSVFTLSTFDTDYVLVKADRAGQAADILRGEGHDVGPVS